MKVYDELRSWLVKHTDAKWTDDNDTLHNHYAAVVKAARLPATWLERKRSLCLDQCEATAYWDGLYIGYCAKLSAEQARHVAKADCKNALVAVTTALDNAYEEKTSGFSPDKRRARALRVSTYAYDLGCTDGHALTIRPAIDQQSKVESESPLALGHSRV